MTYAFTKYNSLTRKYTGIPYVVHPIRVTIILRSMGFSEFTDSNLMIAALLHDLVEDTNVSLEEIEDEFNGKVALIVKELSKPENENKEEWLKKLKFASIEAKLIKMADRIDNLMDMRDCNCSPDKLKSYAEQGKIILNVCQKAHAELAKILQDVIEHILTNYK